ncbi:STAS domain-containing protein [Actinosynnema sp. NPDC023587]|uniref:STAS domain-containing protein n=1 Tax=Actinosynnema sp. NPDC023587 TaxID=3154695 RepID=UPI0033E6C9D1
MNDPILTVALDRPAPGLTVLRAAGELDLHTVPRLLEALDGAAFDAELVIDLAGLGYCDSTGITALITTHQRAQAAGGTLELAGVTPELMRVFHIAGLDQLFSFRPGVDQADETQRT